MGFTVTAIACFWMEAQAQPRRTHHRGDFTDRATNGDDTLIHTCGTFGFQLKVRDERLGEASELQNFLAKLDHFQQWLTRTQTQVATEDFPTDLAEAERLLNQHEQVKEEIDGYAPEYEQLMDYGKKVVEGQDDPQYMFLREVRAQFGRWGKRHL